MYSYSQETSAVDDSILIIQSRGFLGTVVLTLSIFHTTYEISSCVREHPRRFCYIQTRIVINLRLNIVLTALTAFSKSKPNSTLNPFSTRGMCSREAKNKSCQWGNVIGQRRKFAAKKNLHAILSEIQPQ